MSYFIPVLWFSVTKWPRQMLLTIFLHFWLKFNKLNGIESKYNDNLAHFQVDSTDFTEFTIFMRFRNIMTFMYTRLYLTMWLLPPICHDIHRICLQQNQTIYNMEIDLTTLRFNRVWLSKHFWSYLKKRNYWFIRYFAAMALFFSSYNKSFPVWKFSDQPATWFWIFLATYWLTKSDCL